MLLWLLFALMTAAVLVAVLAPLARPVAPQEKSDAGAIEVYRDQLTEVDAEQARGIIDDAEAEAARIEVSRRLLAGASASESRGVPITALPTQRMALAIASAAFITIGSLAVYLAYGMPELPAFPIADRKGGELTNAPLAELIAKVENRLRDEPQDGDGWDVIAPVYFKLDRYRDAANAYARAAAIKGENLRRLAGFAEASVFAADGIVGEEARLASQKILKLEPNHPQALFWLALAKEQDGQLAEAVTQFKALLATAPADAPWRPMVEQRIADNERRLAGLDTAPQRGPTPDDVKAAGKLTDKQRSEMIAQMVDGLAKRLERDGKDLAGWVRLVNAYVALGREVDARAALAKARTNLGDNEKAMAELSALAKKLGLDS